MAKDTPHIKATRRERLGSRYAARYRRNGKLPAVVYGHKEEPTHVAIDRDELLDFLAESVYMLKLDIDGDASEMCLLKDVQYDHLGKEVVHVDLVRTSMAEEVEVNVPVTLKGREDAPGLKEAGAYVDQAIVDVTVRCKANAIPDEIVVDMSSLEVNQTITVGDLTLPAGVAIDQPADDPVVSVHVVAEEEVEATEAEAEGGEPEVVSERKEGEEEA